jgi:hypothetical protein
MTAAIAEANSMLGQARTISRTLGRYNLTLTVPADIE